MTEVKEYVFYIQDITQLAIFIHLICDWFVRPFRRPGNLNEASSAVVLNVDSGPILFLQYPCL